MKLRGEGKVVLLVDDSPEILELMTLVLERRGYEVCAYANGLEAWKSLACRLPNLIILDILMPGMDGLELCEKIKSTKELSEMPVFMMTSATMGSEVSDGFWKIGTKADCFFSKPFNPLQVAAYVDQFLLGLKIPEELLRKKSSGGAARLKK